MGANEIVVNSSDLSLSSNATSKRGGKSCLEDVSSRIGLLLKNKSQRRKLVNQLSTSSRFSQLSSFGVPSLTNILLNRAGGGYSREKFTVFLRTKHGEENLKFYLSAERFYRKFSREQSCDLHDVHIPEADEEDENPLMFAQNVWNRFLKRDATDQINISGSLREEIGEVIGEAKLDPDSISASIFRKAQKEVEVLMEQNNYHEFCKQSMTQAINGMRFLSALEDLSEEQDPQWRLAMARNIVSLYMQVGASFELEILGAKMKRKITSMKKPTRSAFTAAKTKVMKFLVSDPVFSNFLNTHT